MTKKSTINVMGIQDIMSIMADATMSMAETEVSREIINKMRSKMSRIEMALALGLAITYCTKDAAKYEKELRVFEGAAKGLGQTLIDDVFSYIGPDILGKSPILSDPEQLKNLSNFELMAEVMATYRKEKESSYNRMYDDFAFRCNSVGKGKANTGGGKAPIQLKRGNKPVMVEGEDGRKTPAMIDGLRKDMLKFNMQGNPNGWPQNVVDIINIAGEARSAKPLPTKSRLDGYITDKNGSIVKKHATYNNAQSIMELHQKLTAAQETWEESIGRALILSDGKEQVPAEQETFSYDGSHVLLPLPVDYGYGTSTPGMYDTCLMCATVTLTDIPAGHTATVTVSATPDTAIDATPVNAPPADPKKAVIGTVNKGDKSYQGLVCTKCLKAWPKTQVTTYTPSGIDANIADPQYKAMVTKFDNWQGYEVCGSCKQEMNNAIGKATASFKAYKSLEEAMEKEMESILSMEAERDAHLANALTQEKVIEDMRKIPSINDASIQAVVKLMETARANAQGIQHNIDKATANIDTAQANLDTCIANMDSGNFTVPTDPKLVSSAKGTNPNQAKILSLPQGNAGKQEAFNIMDNALNKAANNKRNPNRNSKKNNRNNKR